MSLLESYVSDLKNVPPEGRIFVMRKRGHDLLAPPEDLFRDFKQREKELKARGLGKIEAHNRAWEEVEYERRFADQFWRHPSAIEELKHIAERARQQDVYLICYEKPPKKCHRFLLLQFAREIERRSEAGR
ncbi:MAG: DUF488 family protein [Planctomycetes bacterium]|nr:DUF488 family protein [Planctomycetota bacterium]